MKIAKQRTTSVKDKGEKACTATPARLSHSSAFGTDANPNDDWTTVADAKERRRVQNRLAQRKYRRKKRNARGASQSEDFMPQGPPPAYWVANEDRLSHPHLVPHLHSTEQKPTHQHMDAMGNPFGAPVGGVVQGVLKEHPYISDLFPYEQTDEDHTALFDPYGHQHHHHEKPATPPTQHHHTSAFNSTYRFSRAMDSMLPAVSPEDDHSRNASHPMERSVSLPGDVIDSNGEPSFGDAVDDVDEPNPYLYPFHGPHMLPDNVPDEPPKREELSYSPVMGDIPAMQAAQMTIQASHQEDEHGSVDFEAHTEKSDDQAVLNPEILHDNSYQQGGYAGEDFDLHFHPFDRSSSPPDLELGSVGGSRFSTPGSLPPSTPQGLKHFSYPSLFAMGEEKE